jgi:hypothetical protein
MDAVLLIVEGTDTFHKSTSLRFKSTENANNFLTIEFKIMNHIHFHIWGVGKKTWGGGKFVKISTEEHKLVLNFIAL